jgi:LPXTG-motif cell wall-anchored protein
VANEHTRAHLVNAGLPQEEEHAPEDHASKRLPQSGSSLPLLVLIGAGILAGGIVSALRTRPGSRYR